MATLDTLKRALRQTAADSGSSFASQWQLLSDDQYADGFKLLVQGKRWDTYEQFIIPQLTKLLTPLFNSHSKVSILEIGPGPRSVLEYLPRHFCRKVSRYTAYEPNNSFAKSCEASLSKPTEPDKSVFPHLEDPIDIRQGSFDLDDDSADARNTETYDVVLFCHSLYGLEPKEAAIGRALELLPELYRGEMVVVFHRDGSLRLGGLFCHRTASFPTGNVALEDDDFVIDQFSQFIAGTEMKDEGIRADWRDVCRRLGRRNVWHSQDLHFSAPNVMMAFTRHVTSLPDLTATVPFSESFRVKNREARLRLPTTVLRPTEIKHVQQCVRWAVENKTGLTVVGGGHSGNCLISNVVAVDMSAFDEIDILEECSVAEEGHNKLESLVVVGTGCKTGDIVRKTMDRRLKVPLGSRPSVGAGSWLQGGIGHQARLHGLSCDAIVGAVLVGLQCGEVLVVGRVPPQHQPDGAVRPDEDEELLWAIKGAGTNFGIIISVVFEAQDESHYAVYDWIVPLSGMSEAEQRIRGLDGDILGRLPRQCSTDLYLFWEDGQLQLGVSLIESCPYVLATDTPASSPMSQLISSLLGPEKDVREVDSLGLLETDMYMSMMHGGHAGGKNSSFKRCVFLKSLAQSPRVVRLLASAVENRPSPLSYIHLIHGGEAVADILPDATAFGCRDWTFACVITAIWPRKDDDTEIAMACVQWVYDLANALLPLSVGAYGADLGPDPRDAPLTAQAFGDNRPRLVRYKHTFDPHSVLPYACALPETPMDPRVILLITGRNGVGKDTFAIKLADELVTLEHSVMGRKLMVKIVSISTSMKRQFAAATGADIDRLLEDRKYKEQMRPALTRFYLEKVRQRPRLPEEQFLEAVYQGANEAQDVLIITGMRDEAPVANFAYLVPHSRLVEIRVKDSIDDDASDLSHRPCMTFNNGCHEMQLRFTFTHQLLYNQCHLSPILDLDGTRQLLEERVRLVPDFPRPGILFRHVLDIAQTHDGGMNACTSLLDDMPFQERCRDHALVCCETGGFVFAAALAQEKEWPLVLIRKEGKLPPPTISVTKGQSHISVTNGVAEEKFEMERDVIRKGMMVMVIDDVLASGRTLLAILQLLRKAGVSDHEISVKVVAEFPLHKGRQFLHRNGFGMVGVRSLLVYGGL